MLKALVMLTVLALAGFFTCTVCYSQGAEDLERSCGPKRQPNDRGYDLYASCIAREVGHSVDKASDAVRDLGDSLRGKPHR